MNHHETYMLRCLQLARLGAGSTAPNPMVGSVIVHENRVIGEGYHEFYGGPHAEVNAINAVRDQKILEKSTLYVNLEPCAHFGKTPPCSDLIVSKKIPRVVIGCVDSFSLVAGKGIEHMRKAGIEVTSSVLERESRDLNRAFFTFHEKKRPYVILKWARSADGFIDIHRDSNRKGIAWITQPETRSLVHHWRSLSSAILVGWKTIANDNPHLTCRDVTGKSPMRIIIDPSLRLDYTAFHVGDHSTPTIILTAREATGSTNLRFLNPGGFSIPEILGFLHSLDIQSVFVEGGRTTLEHFLASGLWDETRILEGCTRFGSGEKAPVPAGTPANSYSFGKDRVTIYRND